jgi:hypothetical protein
VYGVEPPDGLAVSVMDCPLSIVGEEGVTAPATRMLSTVTSTAVEAPLVTGEAALSVTVAQYQVFTVGLRPLKEYGDELWPVWTPTLVEPVVQLMVVELYSCIEYVDVPPDHDTWTLTDCPESITVGVGVTVGVLRAELTVTVSLAEQMLSGVEALSVTL